MNRKNNKNFNFDIYLVEIFQNINKSKFTVIFISIFFLLLGVLYSKSLPKKFTTYALVQDLKLIQFNINPLILSNISNNLNIDYYDNFLHQVTSSKTLSDFLIKNKKMRPFGAILYGCTNFLKDYHTIMVDFEKKCFFVVKKILTLTVHESNNIYLCIHGNYLFDYLFFCIFYKHCYLYRFYQNVQIHISF